MKQNPELLDDSRTRRLNKLLADASAWTEEMTDVAALAAGYLEDEQIRELAQEAGHPELVADLPRYPIEGTVRAYGRVARALIQNMNPGQFLALFTGIIADEQAGEHAVEQWREQSGTQLKLEPAIRALAAYIYPGEDLDEYDLEEAKWYPLIEKLITDVRFAAATGKRVLTPREQAAKEAEIRHEAEQEHRAQRIKK